MLVRRRALGVEPAGVSALDGACFDCQGTGACCRWFDLGGVPEAEVEALERLGARRLVPDGGPFAHRGEDGGSAYTLRVEDGACVFQDDAGRCRVHAELGVRHKPSMCRLFPLRLFDTPFGRRAGWLPECAGLHVGALTPVASQLDDLVRDCPPELVRSVDGSGYALADGLPADLDRYPQLEAGLLDIAGAPRPDFDTVFCVLAARLRAAVRSAGGSPDPAVPVEARPFMLDTLSDVFARLANEVLERTRPKPFAAAILRRMLDMVTAGARPAPLTESAAAFLRRELCNDLYTGSVARLGSLPAGLGGFVFACWVTRGYTAARHGEPIEAEQLNEAWSLWHRGYGWRSLARHSLAHRPAFTALLGTFVDEPEGSAG